MPGLWNRIPSPFQKTRRVVASFTGGGGIFLFHGSWPFFRLLVYEDGLEARFMFHCFFIPYDRMAPLPEKAGFFALGLIIRSDLPGVPSRIRFFGFLLSKILDRIHEAREKFSSAKS